MIDKEQQNNPLKNSDKNFNENCTHNKEQIIIDGVDVSECVSFDKLNGQNICCYEDTREDKIPFANFCVENKDCYYKQLARKTHECEKMKYYLNKIRHEELSSLDIEWDEYIAECRCTDYSNIITYVEYGLGRTD